MARSLWRKTSPSMFPISVTVLEAVLAPISICARIARIVTPMTISSRVEPVRCRPVFDAWRLIGSGWS